MGEGIAAGSFFVAGGALMPDAPSYVVRRADEALYAALRGGELCSVLDTRQVGKSSLLVRAAARLAAEGATVCQLDLSALGSSASLEQWYAGLLYRVAAQIGSEYPDAEAVAWEVWERLGAQGLPPGQRWFAALCAALPDGPEAVYLFVDEIDAVRGLPFRADSFFVGVRECLQRRAALDPCAARLVFCLAGAATPSQILDDVRTTPFNVGRRVELSDFTPEEAAPLAAGFRDTIGADAAQTLLSRVLSWTGGHPYLTQRLCQAAAERGARSRADVDAICGELYLSRKARETDSNLTFARDLLLGGDDEARAARLSLYDRVLRGGGSVPFDPGSPIADALRLAGVVRVTDEGRLAARNRVYASLFDRRWVRENLPDAERRRQRQAVRRGVARASLVWGVLAAAILAALYQSLAAQDAAANLSVAERDRSLLSRTVDELARQKAEQEALTERARLRRRDAEAAAARAKGDLKTIEAREAAARTQLTEVERARREASAALAAALKTSEAARRDSEAARREGAAARRAAARAAERANAADTRATAIYGRTASALSIERGSEFEALEFGLKAVEPDLKAGKEPAPAALQGLADAVNVGIVRRMSLLHPGPVTAAAVSPDGKTILTGTKGHDAYAWNALTGERIRSFQQLQLEESPAERMERMTYSVAFSPDGQRVLVGTDEKLGRDPVSGKLTPYANGVRVPEGHIEVRRIRIWDLNDGREPIPSLPPSRELLIPGASIAIGEFLGGASRLVSSGPREFPWVWDLETMRATEFRKPLADSGGVIVQGIAASADGKRVLTAGRDYGVRLWDVAAGTVLSDDPKLKKYEGLAARFISPNLFVYTTRKDDGNKNDGNKGLVGPTLRAVADDGSLLFQHTLAEVHSGLVFGLDASAATRLIVTGGQDRNLHLWTPGVPGAKPLRTLEAAHADRINEVRFTPDGQQFVATSSDGTASVWALTQPLWATVGNATFLRARLSSDGKAFAMLAGPSTVEVRDAATGRVLWSAEAPTTVQTLALSPDGSFLAGGGSGGKVWLWHRKAGTAPERRDLSGHAPNSTVMDLDFSPDGSLLASSAGVPDSSLRVWETATGKYWKSVERVYYWGATNMVCARFMPDGKGVLVGGDDGMLRRHDLGDPDWSGVIASYLPAGRSFLQNQTAYPFAADASPDGLYVASADKDGTIYLWEGARPEYAQHRTLFARLQGHQGGVRAVDFSPDGRTLVSGGLDGRIHFWRVEDVRTRFAKNGDRVLTREPYLTIKGHADAVNSVEFTPDGRQVLTASKDGTVRFFPATAEEYVKRARQILALRPPGKE